MNAVKRVSIVLFLLLVAMSAPAAKRRVNPHLKNVHKIYVADFGATGQRRGETVTLAPGSSEKTHTRIVGGLASSGRFSAVADEAHADARLEGSAGRIDSVENGKKYSSGYANLQLVDVKSKEILWAFTYTETEGACCDAAQRVADQLIQKLTEDAQ